ncbi:MAG TPA: YaeQ family protein [Noviherbaspirillum sp.]|nr:YaeQ family protein [Noviherbaspirillum sp.]
MALKATIFKADLQIADMDRHYYADHTLTIARHPSETDERMMVRLLAFALNADEALAFGRGLSTEDEPDLWRKDLTGAITTWIDVGLPDERRITKACGRSEQVLVYTYGSTAGVWWKQVGPRLERLDKVRVMHIEPAQTVALAALAERTMRLQCTIQDAQVWLTGARGAVEISPVTLSGARG